MTVPEGFQVKLFAGEPDVRQPIAMCLDDRGRVWVAEAYSYPVRRADKDAKDRILIFEDTDGDGKFDKRTVFMEGLNLVSGLEVGFGGVWIGAAPYLMFVPIKEGEDKPAGPAKILLDGWGYHDTHETLNSFSWGPDGWLYGCHGVFTHSQGRQARHAGRGPHALQRRHLALSSDQARLRGLRARHQQSVGSRLRRARARLLSRPASFRTASTSSRAAGISGRPASTSTRTPTPTSRPSPTICTGRAPNQWAANDRSDKMGGGHAHCGLMIYLGGTWPEEYRGQLFMGNIHGHRLNMDVLKTQGLRLYVASHGPDFLLANDAWARFINMRYGPDGNVYLIDWYDKQACHHGDVNIWDRDNGRIYKISYRGTKPVTGGSEQKERHGAGRAATAQNDWYVRHARRCCKKGRLQARRIDNGVHD